ncbi:glycosyltransferase family 2 protein [Nitrospirillum sp. BR 11752]|uniref:glycosyltransferase family 2 protein n=1 Tax=Nitrospirillum sp. BR 11752 TaxID=3104293 RepID=UPI002EA212A7|nr:glycosyltransferase family 2 protein [Nitrospirillum sp. BR 11752]
MEEIEFLAGWEQCVGHVEINNPAVRLPRVSICAIVKNEGDFLLEWVAYYRLMGVDRFVIYDNGSTDGTRLLLDRIAARAGITVVDWPSAAGHATLLFPEARDVVMSLPNPQDFDWWGNTTLGPQLRAYNHFLTYFGGKPTGRCSSTPMNSSSAGKDFPCRRWRRPMVPIPAWGRWRSIGATSVPAGSWNPTAGW